MNVMVDWLVKVRLPGRAARSPRRLVIEDNVGESIHLHYRNLRLDFTIRDFLSFADALGEGAEKLRQLDAGAGRRRPWGLSAMFATVSLADSSLGEVGLEWNEGNVVHLQTESVRLELSAAEFLELAAACREAAVTLRRNKRLPPGASEAGEPGAKPA